jgi:hypothetical protein
MADYFLFARHSEQGQKQLAALEQPILLPRDTDGEPRIHLQNFAALSLVRVLRLLFG